MLAAAAPRSVARRIIARELARFEGHDALPQAVEHAFHQLEGLMACLVGAVGYRTLTLRAIHLAGAELPWLSEVELPLPLSRVTLSQTIPQVGEDQVRAGAETILGHIVDLLCTFIGKDLTFRLIRRVWTDVFDPDAGSSSEGGLG